MGKRRRLKVAVVGAGMAGFSCAWRLARAGHEVHVLERGLVPGGRAGSFLDRESGETLDTGQHIFMGAYRATLSWFRELKTLNLVDFQDRLEIAHLKPGGGICRVRAAALPPPFGLLAGMISSGEIPPRDILRSLGLLRAFLPARGLDDMTAARWLAGAGVPGRVRDLLLDPLALAAMNETPERASAQPLVAVLRGLLAAGPRALRIGLATCGLADTYVPAASSSIEGSGGAVTCGSRIERLLLRSVAGGDRVVGLRVAGGAELEADAVVSTAPPWDFAQLAGGNEALAGLVSSSLKLVPSPILTAHLWWDRPVLASVFAGLLGSPFQWAFDRTRLLGPGRLGAHICLVASAARDLVSRSAAELVALAESEARRYLPDAEKARLELGRTVWEMKATVSLVPGTAALRPRERSGPPGLVLAGDWTDTGLPATIESATLSGLSAADRVLSSYT